MGDRGLERKSQSLKLVHARDLHGGLYLEICIKEWLAKWSVEQGSDIKPRIPSKSYRYVVPGVVLPVALQHCNTAVRVTRACVERVEGDRLAIHNAKRTLPLFQGHTWCLPWYTFLGYTMVGILSSEKNAASRQLKIRLGLYTRLRWCYIYSEYTALPAPRSWGPAPGGRELEYALVPQKRTRHGPFRSDYKTLDARCRCRASPPLEFSEQMVSCKQSRCLWTNLRTALASAALGRT